MTCNAVKKHIESQHLCIKNYNCPICDKKFGARKHMLEHVKKSHPYDYKCMQDAGEVRLKAKEQLEPIFIDTGLF